MRIARLSLLLLLAGAPYVVAGPEEYQATPVAVPDEVMRLGRRLDLPVIGTDVVEGSMIVPTRLISSPSTTVTFRGRRAVLEGMTVEQLQFPTAFEAEQFADNVRRQGNSLVEARGSQVVILSGPAAADAAKVTRALQYAWQGVPERTPRSRLAYTAADGSSAFVSERGSYVGGRLFDVIKSYYDQAEYRDLPVGTSAPITPQDSVTWLSEDHRQLQIDQVDRSGVRSTTRLGLFPDHVRMSSGEGATRLDAANAILDAALGANDAPFVEPRHDAGWLGDPPQSKGFLDRLLGR